MNTSTNKPLVIIGTGLAGYTLAKEWRKIDTNTPLVLVTQDEGHFYSKPQLSTAISYGKNPKTLIVTEVNTIGAQLNATIYAHTTVCGIDSQVRKISLLTPEGPQNIEYEDLVLAIGASPKPFPLLENHQNHFRINNLFDYAKLREKLDSIEDLCIIGSGLVGCEFAHDFSKAVKKLNVITIDPYPLFNLVPEEIGFALQHALEKGGISFYNNALLEHRLTASDKIEFRINSQHDIIIDAVITAIGLQPNCEIAKKAGLDTGQGVMVNSYLQTSEPHIYALGDCAQINGVCRQYVAPILQSARALAQTLATKIPCAVTFPPTPVTLKVQTYPVIVMPPTTQHGQWQCENVDEGIKAVFLDNEGNLKGYALGGKATDYRQEFLKAFQDNVMQQPA